MQLKEFVQAIPNFHELTGNEKIISLGWYLHTYGGQDLFTNLTMRNCFREIHAEAPDMSVYLPRMAARKPPMLLKERGGYRLHGTIRRALDSKYGQHSSVLSVSAILTGLPAKVPDMSERDFLVEALNCYRVGAFRAAIVMTWNLAFDHLCRWLLADPARLGLFNKTIKSRFPKKDVEVGKLDDFEELKESEIIEVCRTAGLFSKNVTDILREKLVRRNISAHPSRVKVTQHQADDVITDLINNVVIQLA